MSLLGFINEINFNLRSSDCYFDRIYLIATVCINIASDSHKGAYINDVRFQGGGGGLK